MSGSVSYTHLDVYKRQVRVWCATGDYWTLYYDLLEQVKEAFDRNGIEMTYNHLNVHLMERERSEP